MIRGSYIAATGMMLQRKKMEVITNNMVNVETSGFKKDNVISVSFEDVMLERIHDTNIIGRRQLAGPLNFGTHVDYIDTDYTAGNIDVTNITTDFALSENAYFVVETPAGERYTRAGAFTVNSEGYLCNPDGYYLLGTNGRVQVGSQDFAVDALGNITVNEESAGAFRIVTFADQQALRKQGNNLYAATQGGATPSTEHWVRQGALETSNVEVSREMVDMMAVYRVYETNQRIFTMIDETIGKAVNDIGRLR